MTCLFVIFFNHYFLDKNIHILLKCKIIYVNYAIFYYTPS
jgi:hypothetical protein